MIYRIVKMTIKPESVQDFKKLFYEAQKLIKTFDGCSRVDLMKDLNNDSVFFTLSFWETEDDLETYRQSYLFKSTWAKVKILFSAKAEAWSLFPDQNGSL